MSCTPVAPRSATALSMAAASSSSPRGLGQILLKLAQFLGFNLGKVVATRLGVLLEGILALLDLLGDEIKHVIIRDALVPALGHASFYGRLEMPQDGHFNRRFGLVGLYVVRVYLLQQTHVYIPRTLRIFLASRFLAAAFFFFF